MCCCPGRVCMLCTCLILVAVAIGLVFGFGVFKDGFHKIKHTFNIVDGGLGSGSASASSYTYHHTGRPFLGYYAPPPY